MLSFLIHKVFSCDFKFSDIFSFAKIYYTDGKSAEEAFRNADNVVLKGSKMTVLYTSFGKAPKKDSTKASPAKRQKVWTLDIPSLLERLENVS